MVPRLLGHVLGAEAGHVDPGLGEEDAGAEYEGEVEDGVDQVHQHRAQRLGRRQDVVGVEKLDVVASVLAAVLDRLDRQVEAKPRK